LYITSNKSHFAQQQSPYPKLFWHESNFSDLAVIGKWLVFIS